MKALIKILTAAMAIIITLSVTVFPVFASEDELLVSPAPDAAVEDAAEDTAEEEEPDGVSVKAIAAAAIIAVVASVGAIAMAVSVKHSVEGSARQPEAAGNIRTTMMMGLVFIETAIIYALIVAILIIFVL